MPSLMWNLNNKKEVVTVEELDQTVDRLLDAAASDRPFTIELSVNEETSMAMVIGRKESHVEFYDASGRPLIHSSRGPWDSDELIGFLHHGHYSELPKRYWVPVKDARDALRRYFSTGSIPDNLEWE